MTFFTQFKGLPKQIYILSVLKVMVGIGSMVFSLVSLIVTDTLGYSAATAGLIAMGLAFVKGAGAFCGGRVADLWGRKISCLILGSITLIFYILGGLFCRTWLVLLFIMFGSIGANGIGSPISAMVADNAPREKSVECFSLLYMCANLGYAIGPSIGGMLYYNHLEMSFYIQGAVYFAAALGAYFLVDENYDPAAYRAQLKENRKNKVKAPEGTLRLLCQRKLLLIFLLCLIVMYICYGMISFMLPLQLKDLFGSEKGAQYIGNIWTVNGFIVVIATALVVGRIKNKHEYVNSAMTCLLYAIGFGMYAFVVKVPLFFLSAVIWSTGEVLANTGAGTFIAQQSPESYRGRFQSLFDIAGYVGKGIAPPICAFVMARAGYGGTWKLNSCFCLIVTAVFVISYKTLVKKEAANE